MAVSSSSLQKRLAARRVAGMVASFWTSVGAWMTSARGGGWAGTTTGGGGVAAVALTGAAAEVFTSAGTATCVTGPETSVREGCATSRSVAYALGCVVWDTGAFLGDTAFIRRPVTARMA